MEQMAREPPCLAHRGFSRKGSQNRLCPLRTLVHREARAAPPAWPLMLGEPPPGPRVLCTTAQLSPSPQEWPQWVLCERRSGGLAGVGHEGPGQPSPSRLSQVREPEQKARPWLLGLLSQSRPAVSHSRTR